jgi:two-component system chemotaxis response regulator CheY
LGAFARWLIEGLLMKTVLIVDDSKSIRNEVADALTPAGYAVIEAANGTEALACLSEHGDIVLVVLDVNMPGMNGLDVLERIQKDHAGRNLAVLMLTTEAERTMVDRAKKAGARGWLLKPIKAPLLVGTVARLTR